jgi:RNA polymerase sigma factor (sigma-70 family)
MQQPLVYSRNMTAVPIPTVLALEPNLLDSSSAGHSASDASAGRKSMTIQEQVTAAYEQYREDVYRYLLMLGLAPAQAQEVAQESFLRLFTSLRNGTEIRHLRAWIFTVAHNLALNSKMAETNVHSYDAIDYELQIPDREPGPESSAIERERMNRLHAALGTLSQQQRVCLLLRAEGFRYREIGEIIGVGTSTVGEFLRRAITRLRKACHE